MNGIDSFSFMLGSYVVFVVFVGVILRVLFYHTKSHNKKEFTLIEGIIPTSEMSKLSPPLVSQLLNGKGMSSHKLVAGLLTLVQKGIIRLKYESESEEYVFYDGDKKNEVGSAQERFLIQWLLYDLGNGKFSRSQIEKVLINPSLRELFMERYEQWEELLKEELENLAMVKVLTRIHTFLLSMAIFMVIVGSIFLFYVPLIGSLYLLLSIALIVVFIVYPRYTKEGWGMYYQWKKFQQRVDKESVPEEDYSQLKDGMTLSFIYAIALQLKQSFVNHFPVKKLNNFTIRNESFPLYFSLTPGAFVLSKESMDYVNELEGTMERVISPIHEISGMDDGDGDI